MKALTKALIIASCIAITTSAAIADPTVGQKQGLFAMQLIKAAHADKHLDGGVTAAKAAEKLASIGLIPGEAWDVEAEFTTEHLQAAYNSLVEANGFEPLENPTPDELIAEIIDLLKKVFEDLEHTRSSNSPTTTRVIGL